MCRCYVVRRPVVSALTRLLGPSQQGFRGRGRLAARASIQEAFHGRSFGRVASMAPLAQLLSGLAADLGGPPQRPRPAQRQQEALDIRGHFDDLLKRGRARRARRRLAGAGLRKPILQRRQQIGQLQEGQGGGHMHVLALLLAEIIRQLGRGLGPVLGGGGTLLIAQLPHQGRPQRRMEAQVAVLKQFGKTDVDQVLGDLRHLVRCKRLLRPLGKHAGHQEKLAPTVKNRQRSQLGAHLGRQAPQ